MTRTTVLKLLWFLWLFTTCTTYYRPPLDQKQTSKRSPTILKPEDQEQRDVLIKKFIDRIKAYLGTPYRYGGDSAEGMDCSGFVATIFNQSCQIQLPHNAYQIYQGCQKISRRELYLGDLVFFSNRKAIDHVGIYLAKDYFVHASVSYGVIVSELNDLYYRSRFAAAGRIVDLKALGK